MELCKSNNVLSVSRAETVSTRMDLAKWIFDEEEDDPVARENWTKIKSSHPELLSSTLWSLAVVSGLKLPLSVSKAERHRRDLVRIQEEYLANCFVEDIETKKPTITAHET